MVLDGRTLTTESQLAGDVCIVGAGPAGLALARELDASLEGASVLLLESGGGPGTGRRAALNEGSREGDLQVPLHRSRSRGLGGTAATWNTPVPNPSRWGRRTAPGAKFVPLDAWDFEGRDAEPDGAWPFGRTELDPYYRRAQRLCGLGPLAYEGEEWTAADGPDLYVRTGRLATRVYQFGRATAFLRDHPLALSGGDDVRLRTHVTAVGVQLSADGRRVVGLEAAAADGRRISVEADLFVLAAGAIENARLLLASKPDAGASAPGDRHGWVGRCLMEHPRDDALLLVPGSKELFRRAGFYDRHTAADGTVVGGRLALHGEAVREEGFPNASATLFAVGEDGDWRADPPRLRERLERLLLRGPLAPLRREVFRGGYGWSQVDDPDEAFAAFRVRMNLEQRPHPENRVTLASERDPLGLPRVRVAWRWRPEEHESLERLRAAVASDLEGAGLGRVEVARGERPDPDAHHHSGTTRMHRNPEQGVVDPDGRVHGTDNLYVAGSSVFPSAGCANPTLTIVALSVRLAEHLADRL